MTYQKPFRRKRIRVELIVLELAILAVVIVGMTKAIRMGLDRYDRKTYPMEYAQLVNAACREKKLDPAFVYAVIHTESRFRPDAVSEVGAKGLMQLMPDAYDWVRMRKGEPPAEDYDALFDPATNIEYGTTLLRMLADEFETPENILCAYHAGWGSVKKWLANPDYAPDGKTITTIPFADTAHYVNKVTQTAEMYRKLYGL